MLQAGVQNFFDPMELGAPQVAHVVKALVDGLQTGVDLDLSNLEFMSATTNPINAALNNSGMPIAK